MFGRGGGGGGGGWGIIFYSIIFYSRGKHGDRVATPIMYTGVFLWPISEWFCICFICLGV